jgi:hypothetical protein
MASLTKFEDLIEESPKIVLKRPGPEGGAKGSETLAEIAGGDLESFWAVAKSFGDPLMIRVQNGKGWKNFNVEMPEEEPETIQAPPQAPPPAIKAPVTAPAGSQFEIFRLQMEMDKIRSEATSAQALDVRWLQHQVDELRKENAEIREKALEQQREAYQKGKDDGESLSSGEGFNIKDFAPMIGAMAQAKPPEQAQPAPEKTAEESPRVMTGADLKSVLGMVMAKNILPEAAPELINQIFGAESLRYVKQHRGELFAEIAQDEDLNKLANGETPELLAKLNEVLSA